MACSWEVNSLSTETSDIFGRIVVLKPCLTMAVAHRRTAATKAVRKKRTDGAISSE